MLNLLLNSLQARIAAEVGADRQAPFFGDRASQDLNDVGARPAPTNQTPPSPVARPYGTGDTAVLVVPACAGYSSTTRRKLYGIKVGVSLQRPDISSGSLALAEAIDAIQAMFGPDQVMCLGGLPGGASAQVKLVGGEDAICVFSPETLPENKHLPQVRDIRFSFAFLVKVSL